MNRVLAFDIYGTLIDTQAVVEQLRASLGERAEAFSQCWREKQLEYSFRRGLMRCYRDFSTCTREALDFTLLRFDLPMPVAERQALLQRYRELPAFDDVAEALSALQGQGCRLYAFSNGTREAVADLLRHAGLETFFVDIVSVDELGSFKPDPAVYHHFLQRTGATAEQAWLISSNAFDVIGAQSVGMRTAWLRRTPQQHMDPWGGSPSATISDLRELEAALASI